MITGLGPVGGGSAAAVALLAALCLAVGGRPGGDRLLAVARPASPVAAAARLVDEEPAGELAGAWDLVAVCLDAGLPVPVAVSAAAEPLTGRTGGHLRRVSGLLELGADPVEAWADARDVAELAPFARAAARSAGTGAALAQVARAEAARIRSELLDSAQARAQRAAVLIAGPLGLCFLPAFLVLGIAPVVVGLAGRALSQW